MIAIDAGSPGPDPEASGCAFVHLQLPLLHLAIQEPPASIDQKPEAKHLPRAATRPTDAHLAACGMRRNAASGISPQPLPTSTRGCTFNRLSVPATFGNSTNNAGYTAWNSDWQGFTINGKGD